VGREDVRKEKAKKEDQPEALKGYEGVKTVSTSIVRDIAPVGVLNICSCSGLNRERFFGICEGTLQP
jgi:hypothetical protein